MKYQFVIFPLIALLVCPLLASSEIKESSEVNEKSKITVIGSAKITIINDSVSNYGSKAEELKEINGGKINFVIKEVDISQFSKTDNNSSEDSKDQISTNTLPKDFTIEKVYPNPFNPTINIRYGLPEQGLVKILIYDLQGKEINKLSLPNQSAGWHNFVWSGTNSLGQSVSTGIYLFTIQVGDQFKQQKITYLK